MKANKFFAVALAALTLGFVACKPDEPKPEEDALALNPTSLQLEVDEEGTIVATVAATWESSDAEVASVAASEDGKTATVKALKEGSAVITAKTAGNQVKTCVVAVKKAAGPVGNALKGSQFWPIILDGTTLEANQSKMVASFQPNDVDQFLYIWPDGSSYAGVDAMGLNFHGNGDGYTAMVVGNIGWSGAGFCLTENGNGWQAAEALRAAIVADPDNYFLHIAIKSTDDGNHTFYFMNNDATKFVLGSAVFDGGTIFSNFDRDGAWHEFDIPMSSYAATLATATFPAGGNVFCMLSGGQPGIQLNLDAVYFYKK